MVAIMIPIGLLLLIALVLACLLAGAVIQEDAHGYVPECCKPGWICLGIIKCPNDNDI
jgi:hypothetical protein